MRRGIFTCIVALALVSSTPAFAQVNPFLETKARTTTEIVVRTYVWITAAEALTAECKRSAPQNAAQHDAALKAWRATASATEFEAIVDRFAVRYPAFAKVKATVAPKATELARSILAKHPAACTNLPAIFVNFPVAGRLG